MLLEIQTKEIDVNTWNALIFVVTTLITVLLGVIAYYEKTNSDSQKELVKEVISMGKDMATMKQTGIDTGKDVERIRKDLEHHEDKINDHEKRIYKLEKIA